MKGGEYVRHVIAGVGEDYGAAGVVVPGGDVVYFVLVDDPGVVGCDLTVYGMVGMSANGRE